MQIGEISNETQQIPVSEPILFYLGLLEYFLLGFSDPANLLEQYCLEKHHVRFLFFYQKVRINLESVQFSSVAQSCPTLCDLMNRSTPGLPVQHQLLELTQTHAHRVGDAIQPSHPLSFPSPPAPIPPSIRVFSNESILRMRWPRYWSFSISPSNEHPGLISFRMDWLDSNHQIELNDL